MNTDDRALSVAVAPSEAPSETVEKARGGGRDNVHPLAARTHGAHSEPEIAPLRTEHLARLRRDFPAADNTVLYIQAERAAQLDLIGAFLDRKAGVSSVIRNRRTTTVWPAREYAAKVQSAYESTLRRLEEQHEVNGGKPGGALAAIEAEIAADGDDGADDE